MPLQLNIDIETLQNKKIESQFTFLVKAVNDLFECLKTNKDELFVNSIYSAMLQDQHLEHNANALIQRTESILNNISGTTSGYHKELQLAFKQSNKKVLNNSRLRTLHFGARGDVAIDYGNGFGKAIQSKSSFADGNADINTMIKVAANQLTGERVAAETPNIKDRRIIDVSIMNPLNPWPRSYFGNTPFTLDELEVKIHELVSDYIQHNSLKPKVNNPNAFTKQAGKGYNNWQEITPNMSTRAGQGGSGQNISRFTGTDQLGNVAIGIDLAVKIRYETPRPFLINGKIYSVGQVTTRTDYNDIANTIYTQTVICKVRQ